MFNKEYLFILKRRYIMAFLTTTFSDIFKSNFLENITSVSILDMIISIVLAFGMGMFIFLV